MTGFVAELHRGKGPVRATGVASPREGSWIAGEVRLDGRAALRDALGAAGVATPRDATDAALVFAAWNAWRETATERLRGDFSFALWDAGRRVLFCARDALGIRPLYWAQFGGAFVCASELELVRSHPHATSRLHEPAIASFLLHGFNDDTATTSFADIRRLPPGHQLTIEADAATAVPRRYWSFPEPKPLRLTRDDEYVERFREVLDEAVRDRLRSDRAAILLSGGLDSTSLAAVARRVRPSMSLHAWTTVPSPSLSDDESPLAGVVAARLDIRHDVVRTDVVPFAHLDDPDFHTAEPLDEPGWSSWRALLRKISADASVLVAGEDGDALFRPPGLLAMVRTWGLRDVLGRIITYCIAQRRRPHLGFGLGRRATEWWRGSRRTSDPIWLRDAFVARAGYRTPRVETHATRADAHARLSDPVWQGVLEMARPSYTGVPLDFVWPLLDTRVLEFVFSIPPVPWCQRKELLRRAFRDELPPAIVAREKSPLHGFYEWQAAHWRASVGARAFAFNEHTEDFVDTRRVIDTLQYGPVCGVFAAWRVLALDHWLRSLEGRGSTRNS